MNLYILLISLYLATIKCQEASIYRNTDQLEDLGYLVASIQALSLGMCAHKCKRHKKCGSIYFTRETKQRHLLQEDSNEKKLFMVTDQEQVSFIQQGQKQDVRNFILYEEKALRK